MPQQLEQETGPRDTAPIEPPPPEISPVRVVVLLLVLAGIAIGAWRLLSEDGSSAGAEQAVAPVYAPYVDVTLTPTYPFQLPSANPVSRIFLGFVVGEPSAPCTPSWGGYYTLDEAAQSLDLDSRVAQLRSQGGSAMVSFGGRDNTELAVGCTDPRALAAAYLAPIQRYRATTIDLDLEGASLADPAANLRRATAIAAVQRRQAAAHEPLQVWVTLPVSGQGLTPEGEAAVKELLAAHVNLAGVNAMAMDFGAGQGASQDMLGTIERALGASEAQVQSLWHGAGLPSGAGSGWAHLGVTVMLGVNDVRGQRFTTDDAHGLAGFVRREGIPRVSAWSLNRDSECGGAFPRLGVASSTCSGVLQQPLQFTHIFGRLPGTRTARRPASSIPEQQGPQTASTDDPAKSPYPIWRPVAEYVAGYKVVWQGQIYQAAWWTQAVPPGSGAVSGAEEPWQPIGPVPPGSRAPKPIPLIKAHPPRWSPSTVYRQGARVSFEGLPYRARWYTRGEQPLDELPGDLSTPWEPLFTYPGEPRDAEGGVDGRP